MLIEVHGAGGDRTRVSLIRPVASLKQLSYDPDLLQRVMELRAAGEAVQEIARRLTEEGWRPVQGSGAWTYAKVCRFLDQPEARSLKQSRKPLTEGMLREAHEWTTLELSEALGMSRESLHNWIQKGRLQTRKVFSRGRSVWLIWADEAELNRLRELRAYPYYGAPRPRVEPETDEEQQAGRFPPGHVSAHERPASREEEGHETECLVRDAHLIDVPRAWLLFIACQHKG